MKIRKRRDGSAKRLRIGLNGCFFPSVSATKRGVIGDQTKKKKPWAKKRLGDMRQLFLFGNASRVHDTQVI